LEIQLPSEIEKRMSTMMTLTLSAMLKMMLSVRAMLVMIA
jgi:hypothetical protein